MADEDQTVRLYHDMHTGKWWWRTQVCSSHVRLVDLRELMHEPVHSERLKTPRNQRTVPLFPSSSRPTKRSLHNSATRPPTLCTSRLAIFPKTHPTQAVSPRSSPSCLSAHHQARPHYKQGIAAPLYVQSVPQLHGAYSRASRTGWEGGRG